MMKNTNNTYLIYALLFLLTINVGFSQITEPVTWSTAIEKVSDLDYNLIFTASIEKNWHLYSQNVPENGPLPTLFKLTPDSGYTRIGEVSEEKGTTVYEDVFEMKIKYFETKAIFKQAIKIVSKKHFKILGTIDFMSCNSESCLPGSSSFEIDIE